MIRIALIGDFQSNVAAHQGIPKALALSAAACGCQVEPVWLPTDKIKIFELTKFAAFWAVPATPYRSMQGALKAIRFARETGRPFIGTCGGFQHAAIEFAREVVGIMDADSEETNPGSPSAVVSKLACPLVEAEETINLMAGSRLLHIYGVPIIRERYHCNFGLSGAYVSWLESSGMLMSAVANNEVRAFELPSHPFFMATLFQPERSGLAGAVHPLITAFVKAAH